MFFQIRRVKGEPALIGFLALSQRERARYCEENGFIPEWDAVEAAENAALGYDEQKGEDDGD